MTEESLEITQLRQKDFDKPVQVAYVVGAYAVKKPYRGVAVQLLAVLSDGRQFRHDEMLYTDEKWRWKLDSWKKALWIPPEVTAEILMEDPQFYFMIGYLRWTLNGKFSAGPTGRPYFAVSGAAATPFSKEYPLEYFARRWMWWKATHGKRRGEPIVNIGNTHKLIREIRAKVDELETAVTPAGGMLLGNPPKRAVGKPVEAEGLQAELESVGDYV